MTDDNIAGVFLVIGVGLLIISMGFNYTAFSSMSDVLIQQIAFITMALLFDSLKISSAIGCKNLWARKNQVMATFTFIMFILLTCLSIIENLSR